MHVPHANCVPALESAAARSVDWLALTWPCTHYRKAFLAQHFQLLDCEDVLCSGFL